MARELLYGAVIPMETAFITPGASWAGRSRKRGGRAAFTLVEAVVALTVFGIGLSGVYLTNAQLMRMLARSKETMAARQAVQARMDQIRSLRFPDLASPAFVSGTLLANGVAGDALASDTKLMLPQLKERVTIHALGDRLFSDATGRLATAPLRVGETASELSTVAPAPPLAFVATGTTAGAWVPPAAAFPRIEVLRTGNGATATSALVTSASLAAYPQVRVDVEISWLDLLGKTRTQMSSTVVAKQLVPR